MIDYEKVKDRLERRVERRRVQAAAWASGLAAVFALALALVLAYGAHPGVAAIIQPFLALTLSAGLTLGARAIDGPIQLAGRRGEATSTSAGAAALLLWLGCFCAIQIAFLVVDVVGRWNTELPACPTGATDRLETTVTIFNGAQRSIAVADCRVGKPKRAGETPSILNGQAPANAGAGDDEGAGD